MKTINVTGITWAGSDIPKDVIHVHAMEEIISAKDAPAYVEVTIVIPKMLLKPLGINYPNMVDGISETMDTVIEEVT